MRQKARTKQHIVKYKGWILVQVPWKCYGYVYYAKWLFDSTGQERMHAGYSKYCSHKQLRLMIRDDVNKLIPVLNR